LAASPPAHEAAGLEHVRRAAGARPRAHLVSITEGARARAAQRPPVPRRVLTRHVGAIALVERAGVAVGGARRAARLLRVDGACATRRTWTIVCHVALAASPPTHEAAGLEHVRRAAGARPRAHLVRVTEVARARAAQRPPVPRRVRTRHVGP